MGHIRIPVIMRKKLEQGLQNDLILIDKLRGKNLRVTEQLIN